MRCGLAIVAALLLASPAISQPASPPRASGPAAATLRPSPAATALPAGFARLREVAPSIRQDMRYATPFNFTGRRVPGYDAAECILLRPAAEALARAQARLLAQGYSLKVYDCYRPERAVRSFIAWAQSPEPDYMGRVFSPHIPKAEQFARGYLAKRSRHSLGIAVDIGLVRADEKDLPTPTDAGPCDGPFAARARESSLDFGTAYDCSSPLSATASPRVNAEARANRDLLRRALAAEGFRNYSLEWWHFDFTGATAPLRSYDFPVR
jgi:D-alanyl-D-alanine dipeptidase